MDKEQGHKLKETGHKPGRRGRSGAQTFRRGRALAFYQQLVIRRETLKVQLECSELHSIHQVIAGELKATEMIMNDFKAAFELAEMTEEKTKE
ncbi:hypothetical protein [Lysinibacillus odysseyi]|uniref:hypothetical protein n=1 Tax=Lysinibacillus odysseyi TaxID=202611 RepID=UPI00068C6756|nr:hypothetical protein [Lysinibacillus odysseyi]